MSDVTYYEQERVKLKHVTRGAVIVNGACIHRKSHDIVCIYVDLRSKYIAVGGSCNFYEGPGVCLDATVETVRTRKVGVGKASTIICFPAYIGWHVFSAEAAGDTVAVTLVKDGPLVLVPRAKITKVEKEAIA